MREEDGCGEAAWVADRAYRFRAAFLIIGEQNGSRHSRRMRFRIWTRGIALPFLVNTCVARARVGGSVLQFNPARERNGRKDGLTPFDSN